MFLLSFVLLNVFIELTLAFTVGVPKIPGLGLGDTSLLSIPLIPVPKIPGLSGLNFDPLSLKNVGNFIPGWGMFNLDAEVHKVIFTLQNARSKYAEEILNPSDLRTFEASNWDNKEKTILVIHGYTEDGSDSPFSATKKVINAYAKAKRPENLVFVDWHELSRQVNYFRSANNTEKVGLYVAELLIFLRNSNYVKSLEDVHIVGFSLGAHVSGIAGYYAYKFLDEQVARITGLDPAGPGFGDVSPESRLDPDDAHFVDVIHTNMGTLLTTFGTTLDAGKLQFYPNGGQHQPGCSLKLVGEVVGVCSHLKATEYFSASVLGKVYNACPCTDYATYVKSACLCQDPIHMGEFVDQRASGKYYLTIPVGE